MPNEWSHESGTSSNQITPGGIGIARHIGAVGSPLPGKPRWFVLTTGWAVSILVHLLIAGGFLVFSFSGIPAARSERSIPTSQIEEEMRPLEQIIPVSDLQMDLADLTPSSPELLPDESPPLPLNSQELPMPSLSQDTISVLGGSAASRDLTVPMGKTGQNVYKSSFCGTEGMAGCVGFVVDYSGSMVVAFDYVRAELKRSIEQLSPGHYFQIVFFAGGEPAEFASGQMVRATRENRRLALRFVEEMKLKQVGSSLEAWQAVAGAMEKALRAKSGSGCEVQLIYLLTDGEFDHEKVEQAISGGQIQRTKAAVINVLACGNPDNEDFLSRLAKNYKGQYRFITDEEMARQPKELP